MTDSLIEEFELLIEGLKESLFAGDSLEDALDYKWASDVHTARYMYPDDDNAWLQTSNLYPYTDDIPLPTPKTVLYLRLADHHHFAPGLSNGIRFVYEAASDDRIILRTLYFVPPWNKRALSTFEEISGKLSTDFGDFAAITKLREINFDCSPDDISAFFKKMDTIKRGVSTLGEVRSYRLRLNGSGAVMADCVNPDGEEWSCVLWD